jgi:hypothetical protein
MGTCVSKHMVQLLTVLAVVLALLALQTVVPSTHSASGLASDALQAVHHIRRPTSDCPRQVGVWGQVLVATGQQCHAYRPFPQPTASSLVVVICVPTA